MSEELARFLKTYSSNWKMETIARAPPPPRASHVAEAVQDSDVLTGAEVAMYPFLCACMSTQIHSAALVKRKKKIKM